MNRRRGVSRFDNGKTIAATRLSLPLWRTMQKSTKNADRSPSWIVSALVACVLVGGLIILAWTYVFAFSFSAPRGFLPDKTEWPEPIAALFDDSEIEVYGLPQFLDDRIVAQIYGHNDLIENLIQTNGLQATDSSHPVVPKLRQALPGKWVKWQDAEDDRWYATKEFGNLHLEGQDLFLLVNNPEAGRTLIYYNWIF